MTRHTVPDLLPGTLDLLILRTLQTQSLHGWAISERIQQISQDVLQINQGSLYPALHRLEHQGWIEAEWAVSELGRRAKYYRLTRIRTPATGGRSRRVGTHVHGHRPRDEAGVSMMNLRDLFLRLRALVAPRRVERELDEELAFHIERETAEAHRRRSEPRRRPRPGAGALRPGAAGRRPVPRRSRHRLSSTTWCATSSTRSARSAARRSPRSPSSRRWPSASGSSPWCSRSTTCSSFASMRCGVPASCLPWSGVQAATTRIERMPFTRPDYDALRRETSVFTDAVAMLSDGTRT